MLAAEDVLVDRNARAGFLFFAAGGSVDRSVIRKNVFAIDLENGSVPLVGEDNHLVDNQANQVTISKGLKSAPIPSAPKPTAPY